MRQQSWWGCCSVHGSHIWPGLLSFGPHNHSCGPISVFFLAAVALLSWPKWKSAIIKHKSRESFENRADLYLPRPKGSSIADWLFIIGYVVLVSWMMFASFNAKGGKLQIANPEYSDFGPNTALMQSFAVGHNFPTEYPHFSGDRIRYHFLFYFQAGNLEFLGLDPAWSLNLLSIATLVAMLVVCTHAWGSPVQFARSRTLRFPALFLFRIALLRPVSSEASISSARYSSDHPSTRLSSDDLSVSRRGLGYLVSSDLSQPAALCQRHRDRATRPAISRCPLPRGTGGANKNRAFQKACHK